MDSGCSTLSNMHNKDQGQPNFFITDIEKPARTNNIKLDDALYESVKNYDFLQLRYLLQEGANRNADDHGGRSVIHVLLSDGFYGHINEIAMLECLKILIEYKCDINAKDENGESPLCLAVHHGFITCASYLVKHGAETSVRSAKFKGNHALATTLAITMPDVMMECLDAGVTLEQTNNLQPLVKLDWSPVLQLSTARKSDSQNMGMRRNKYKQRETAFIYSLLDLPLNERYRFLKHPLIAAFLHVKEKTVSSRIKWFQYLLSVYPVFYMIFTYFLYFDLCKLERRTTEDGETSTAAANNVSGEMPLPSLSLPSKSQEGISQATFQECEIQVGITIAAYLLMAVLSTYGAFEIFMLLRIDTRYTNKNWRTWVVRISIITMAVTLWPGLQFDKLYNITWQYPIAAMGIFFAWVMFLIQMELVPQVKVYLEMLVAVLLSVLKISLLFLPLLIGFFMGFNLIYSDIGGIMNFILMTVDVGSDEYEQMIGSTKDESRWFTIYANIFSFAFILIIAIVFMNFLLGASISDIQELKHNAKIMTVSNKVQNVFIIDLLFSSRYYVVSKKEIKEKQWYFKFHPSEDGVLPKDVCAGLTNILKSKYSRGKAGKGCTPPTLLYSSKIIESETHSYDLDQLITRIDRMEGKLNSMVDEVRAED